MCVGVQFEWLIKLGNGAKGVVDGIEEDGDGDERQRK